MKLPSPTPGGPYPCAPLSVTNMSGQHEGMMLTQSSPPMVFTGAVFKKYFSYHASASTSKLEYYNFLSGSMLALCILLSLTRLFRHGTESSKARNPEVSLPFQGL